MIPVARAIPELTSWRMPVLLLLLGFSGCVPQIKKVQVSSIPAVAVPSGRKIPMSVTLLIDESYSTYSHTFRNIGDPWVYPLGPALSRYAISICEQVFESVTIRSNNIGASTSGFVLTPRVWRSALAPANNYQLTVLVEWTLRDNQNKNILWVATIDGTASQRTDRKLFQPLIDDLTIKTGQALLQSEEIRRAVAQHP